MIRRLGAGDFRAMPWANGKGQTLELVRVDRDGALVWRLSVAQVTESGPFSRLPGLRRNLTVISGPGFRLTGPGLHLTAAPLTPVAFDGGADISAVGVTDPSDDFNVMVTDRLPPPRVAVRPTGTVDPPPGGLTAVLPLTGPRTLILADEPLTLPPGLSIVVALPQVGPLPAR